MTVWVLPDDSWQHEPAQDGDVLLHHAGDVLVIGRMVGESPEWLGPVPEGVLDVAAVTEPQERADLQDAAQPIADAVAQLGA